MKNVAIIYMLGLFSIVVVVIALFTIFINGYKEKYLINQNDNSTYSNMIRMQTKMGVIGGYIMIILVLLFNLVALVYDIRK